MPGHELGEVVFVQTQHGNEGANSIFDLQRHQNVLACEYTRSFRSWTHLEVALDQTG